MTTKKTPAKKAAPAKKTTAKSKAPAQKAVSLTEPTLATKAELSVEATAVVPAATPEAPVAAAPKAEAPVAEMPVATEAATAKVTEERQPQPQPKPQLTVGMLQQRLSELGYYHGWCDGHYGPLTAQAVGHFQYNNGIHPNGEANQATLSRLGF